jgi:Tol biopolymer transport system component
VARLARLAVLSLVALVAVAPAASAATRPNRIVFERAGDLYALRLGHRPVRLTNTDAREHQPAWSPSRRQVAFAVGRRAVGVLDLASGKRRVIAALPDRFDEIGAVTWSPSGTGIDFAAMNNFRHHGRFRLNGTVWTVRPDGTGLREIVNGQGLITGLGFSPDGVSVFASTEWPNGVTLWHPHAPLGVISFRPEGSDLRVVSKTLASDLDVSQAGPRIAYRGWTRTCHACGEIWRMSARGTGAHVIALPPKGYFGLYEPRFSPNGRRIALLASKGRRASLWIMRPDGSRLHRVLGHVSGLDW